MWLYRLSRTTAGPVARALFPIRTEGLDRIPRRPPFIVAANHASFLDPWFIGFGLAGRPGVSYLINERWYGRSRVWQAFFRANGVVPAAGRSLVGTVERCVAALEEGRALAIFPEGKISPDGTMQRARLGVGWMAALSGVAVVPCGLEGTHDALPRQRRIPRLRPITIRVGAPRRFPAYDGPAPDAESVHRFVSDLVREIARLAGQERHLDRALPEWPPRDLGPRLRARLKERMGGIRAEPAAISAGKR